jgi:hypothetical protein
MMNKYAMGVDWGCGSCFTTLIAWAECGKCGRDFRRLESVGQLTYSTDPDDYLCEKCRLSERKVEA